MTPEVQKSLEEAEKQLSSAKWKIDSREGGATFYEGTTKTGWRFIACKFTVSGRTEPGYDATATYGARVIRLTRELAERACKLAEESVK